MRVVAMDRAREELSGARAAEMQSEISARALFASQQQLVAEKALEAAEDAAATDSTATFDAKAALEETRRFSIEAQHHALHARELLTEFDKLPEQSAAEAVQALRKQIKLEAYTAAQAAAATLPAEANQRHQEKLIDDVAAAMEPYHLALLRAQKGQVVAQAKAQSAARAANKLHGDSIKWAQNAQKLQELGMPGEAIEVMNFAHGAAREGLNMQEWAKILQSQAEQLQSSLPVLQGQLQQAAVSAAQRSGSEVVPVLPEPCGGGPAPAPAPAPAASI